MPQSAYIIFDKVTETSPVFLINGVVVISLTIGIIANELTAFENVNSVGIINLSPMTDIKVYINQRGVLSTTPTKLVSKINIAINMLEKNTTVNKEYDVNSIIPLLQLYQLPPFIVFSNSS
jgi:hypothetical protein